MDAMVAVGADQGQLVDVGFALCWSVPGNEMMGLARGVTRRAQHAATVSHDECEPLTSCDVALAATLPEHFANV